jgi:hypothetical protein
MPSTAFPETEPEGDSVEFQRNKDASNERGTLLNIPCGSAAAHLTRPRGYPSALGRGINGRRFVCPLSGTTRVLVSRGFVRFNAYKSREIGDCSKLHTAEFPICNKG